MRLVQCTIENGYFPELRAQWRQQYQDEEGVPEELYTPYLDHAQREAEKPTSKNGGIYAVIDENGEQRHFDALIHMNYAWPRQTVRVVWQYLAPKYLGDEVSGVSAAPVFGAILQGAWAAYREQWTNAVELKIYCRSGEERRLYESGVIHLKALGIDVVSDRGGSWLHIRALANAG